MVYRILTATVLTTFTVCSCGYSSGEENTKKRVAEAKKLLEKTSPELKKTDSPAVTTKSNKTTVIQALELLNTVEAPKVMPPEVAPKVMDKEAKKPNIKSDNKVPLTQKEVTQCDYFTLVKLLKQSDPGTIFVVLNRTTLDCVNETCLTLSVSENRRVFSCDIPGEPEKAVFECWIQDGKPMMQKIMMSKTPIDNSNIGMK
jgi:hypothetical protein